MAPLAPILPLASSAPGLEIVVWLVAGGIWLLAQMAAAKKRKEQQERQNQTPPPAGSRSEGGMGPTPNELAEIFKRLGADIPSTPPPPPVHAASAPLRSAPSHAAPFRSTPQPVRQPQPVRHPVNYNVVRKPVAAARVRPEIAKRLAQAKREAAEADRLVDAARVVANAIVPGVQSREGESRAFDTATRHSGTILPRLYAMSMRLVPLPSLPMPGVNRSHHPGDPWNVLLHTRRDLRNAVIAQTFLSPAKSVSP